MSSEAFNSLERIVKLEFPLIGSGSGQIIKKNVPEKDFVYDIQIGKNMPEFTYLPLSAEIFHRLVLRAAIATSLSEFDLKKSNC